MRRARKTLILGGSALALIGASAVVRSDPVALWNPSSSVPVGFYAVIPIETLEVGALVAVRPPEPLEAWLVENRYLGHDTPLLKHIAALSGAEVCRDGAVIRIDGEAIAEARERDRLDRPLPVWSGCHRLTDGKVFFLNADHPASLDGRYFGPLGAETIIGQATPIWTRED
ncbi:MULTISPECIES: S26 family signal peptidase [unclassified Roseitalea]|uniref:S26 family signal peptidase n=1 Tax=unclassified Roseitalea TaxID=2639107 RepID=UPI00273DAF2C|nr:MULTISPECIES: S26 family signal peptidase [unclassified Roseitalea]